jgi:hypothetical protein
MSRGRGNALQNALATYLRAWWPHAESAGAGRNGRDILGTLGVAFEVKTADDFKRDFKPTIWIKQAKENATKADVPVVVYFPRGLGEAHTAQALAILPLDWLMKLLDDGTYTPASPAVRWEAS